MPSIEEHPLKPFLPHNAKLLMLGSFPPQQKRWSMDFFYPNLQNDMWRIMGMIFFADKHIFVDNTRRCFRKTEIEQFAEEAGIAFYDTAETCCVPDAFLGPRARAVSKAGKSLPSRSSQTGGKDRHNYSAIPKGSAVQKSWVPI